MEHRSHKGDVELRASADGNPVITGYAAVFNRDSADMGFIEQVDPAAFNRTLTQADVRGLGNHEPDWLLGRSKSGTLRLSTDSTGLRYEIDVNVADPDGQRAVEKIRRRDMDGSSFSFQTIRDEWNWETVPPQRRLLEVALVDVGPVTFPAYPDATASARAMRGALEPIAARCGRDVSELVDAMKAGEIRSLIDGGRKEPVVETETRALTVAWGPEDGVGDLMGDCEDAINAGGWRYCVYDLAVSLDKIVIIDYIDGTYWVAPITVDDQNAPTVSDPSEWTQVETGWVADDARALVALSGTERRAGARLSQESKDAISAAISSLRDLLGDAEDGAPLVEDETEVNAARLRELELRGRELAA